MYHPVLVKNLKQILYETFGVWYIISLCWKQNFQNLWSSLRKRENPSKTRLWEQKYNLKAMMQHDHKSHMGSLCRSCCLYLYSHRLTKCTIYSKKCSCFCPCFSLVMLLLCAFFRLKELFKVKNGLTMS